MSERDVHGLTPEYAKDHAENVAWWRGLTDEKRLKEGERTLLHSIQHWMMTCECVAEMERARAAEKAALAQVDAMALALARAKVPLP